MQTSPAAQRVVGLGLGVVVLGLLAVLAIALPKADGATGPARLPATLAGGWTATDALDVADLPAGAGVDEAAIEQEGEGRDYALKAYAEVYDEAPAFRSYIDKNLESFALVTVFSGESHAFLPGTPPVDPKVAGLARSTPELVREGEGLCSVSYQAVAEGQDAGAPTSVACQLPTDGRTVQIQAQGVTVDEAFTLLDEIAEAVA